MPGQADPEDAPTVSPALGKAGWARHAQRLRAGVDGYAGLPAFAALDAALKSLAATEFDAGVRHAEAALALDPGCALAWRLIGLCREGRNESIAALEAYQSAYQLAPGHHDILSDLGRLALTLSLPKVAAEFFAKALVLEPGSAHLAGQLSAALRDSHEYGAALSVLQAAIEAAPASGLLWNAAGGVLLQQGETEQALGVIEHAIALDPDWPEPLYNRAIARLELGDFAGAAADCERLLPRLGAHQTPAAVFVRAQARLAAGDLAGGWADYRVRLEPDYANSPVFACPGRRWTPTDDLEGARFLVVGEQGLGDEIMFAALIPGLIEALGGGRLILAVAPRLVSLFARSFPEAAVCAYDTRPVGGRTMITAPVDAARVDLWAPLGALAERFAADPGRLAASGRAGLVPDPERIAHWRGELARDPRPKIGVTWKSRKTHGHRLKHYPPFETWASLLRTPHVGFVNLQYGDTAPERAEAGAWGSDLWTAPDLDLTDDIDGAAALSAAVDLVIGVGNASTNLAAAVGVPAWFVTPRVSWPRLGTDRMPWYPNTRVFAAERFNDWDGVFERLVAAVERRFSHPGAAMRPATFPTVGKG